MALPSTLYTNPQPWRPGVFGKAINFVPGDPTIPVEVQRASDAVGTGATTIATGLLFPKPGAPYVDFRPTGTSWFYRARHNGPGYDPGAYTAWVGGLVRAIPWDVLGAAVNFGGGSVYPIIRSFALDDNKYAFVAATTDGLGADRAGKIDGQNRTLAQLVTYLVPNSEFDIWESASQPHAWSVDTGDTSSAAKDTSTVFSGDAAAKFSFGGGGSAGTYRGVTTNDLTKGSFCVPLRPGVPCTLKVASRVSSIATAQAYRITVNHNAARTLQSIKTIAYRAATAYQVDEFTFVTPATAEANAEIKIEFTRGSTTATDFWVDSLRIDETEVKEIYDNGVIGGPFTIDWANGQRQKVQLSATGQACTFLNAIPGAKNTLLIQQDAAGNRALPVFDATVMWANNTPPTLSTAAGVTDELAFVAQTTPTLRYYGSLVATGYVQPAPSASGPTDSFNTASAATGSVNMPATVVAGELLLMFVGVNNISGFGAAPTGWTVVNAGASDTGLSTIWYGKVATGSEGGTSVTVNFAANGAFSAQVYRISKWFGTLATGVSSPAAVSGSSVNPNPASATPSWGADQDLWIAAWGAAGNVTTSAYPTNYTNGDTQGNASNPTVASARRTLYAATEDPGTGTISASVRWHAYTVAVRPPA